MVDLRDLPVEHPLRNRPIGEVNPLYRVRGDTLKPKPCSHWKIGRSTYNQLAEFWTQLGEFLIPEELVTTTNHDHH